MRRWLWLLAVFTLLGCDSSPDHGAHEVPVSKATSPEPDKDRPETGTTQKIPMH